MATIKLPTQSGISRPEDLQDVQDGAQHRSTGVSCENAIDRNVHVGVVSWPTSGSFQQPVRIKRMRSCRSAARCSRWGGWVQIFINRVEMRCRTMARHWNSHHGSSGREAHPRIRDRSRAGGQCQLASRCHRCQDGTQGGQSPGLTTTHDVGCNLELCTIVFQRRWRTRTKDTRMGRTHSFFHRRSR